jgi:uncharacterized protein (TIGR02145 family)
MCGGAPCVYYPPSGVTSNGSITTFTNVMYDFQQQTIEAYGFTTTPAPPVSYQWYAKRKGTADTDYKGISGATALTYTAPANFITNIWQPLVSENNADYKKDNIIFVCLAKYADGTFRKSAEMDILFIGTTTEGYKTINGVKCLTLNKAGSPFNVALTNLDDDPNTDAKNLGDFYQWGRIADGHQKTVWKKGTDHRDSITLMIGGSDHTSAVVAYSSLASNAATAAANYDVVARNNATPFHQVLSSSGGYGKFISSSAGAAAGNNQWYNPGYNINANDNYLWGQSDQHVTDNRTPLKNGNDPCPSGFKIPSRWTLSDLYDNDGTTNPNPSTNYTDIAGTNNTWTWRASNGTNYYTVGGALITNSNGEILFLPAAGLRTNTGALSNIGSNGTYWSSTFYSANYAYYLSFGSNAVDAGYSYYTRAYGLSVRCVAE